MNRFYNKSNYSKYIFISIIIVFSISYLYLFNKYDSVKELIYKSNNIEVRNVFREMMYSSLNKVIDYNPWHKNIRELLRSGSDYNQHRYHKGQY